MAVRPMSVKRGSMKVRWYLFMVTITLLIPAEDFIWHGFVTVMFPLKYKHFMSVSVMICAKLWYHRASRDKVRESDRERLEKLMMWWKNWKLHMWQANGKIIEGMIEPLQIPFTRRRNLVTRRKLNLRGSWNSDTMLKKIGQRRNERQNGRYGKEAGRSRGT